VATAIAPYAQGRVHFRGTSWPARCVDAVCLAPGAIVEVIDRHNLTLIVRAVTPQLV
jgi:membrane protein implicated in regulation of membrane protease activity